MPTAVDRFISLWEMAGEALEDPILNEASNALRAGGEVPENAGVNEIFDANKELLTLHELIGHRLFQILTGMHKARTYVL